MKHPALFLDRDGTINAEVDFLTNPEELHILPGSFDALRDAKALGFRLVVITNQSGIARGLLTEERLGEIHDAFQRALAARGASVDAIYYCPHHPDQGAPPYRTACDCRKPKPGMILRAAEELQLDLGRSFLVGDRMVDIQAGNAAGVPSILVRTGYGAAEVGACRANDVPVAFVADDLPAAVSHIRAALSATHAVSRGNTITL